MVTSHSRGHKIYFDGYYWRYLDNGQIVADERPCIRCGKIPTPEGHDACLGTLKGVLGDCCGHGVEMPILNGQVIAEKRLKIIAGEQL
jgi:hypothetical protein